MVIIHDTLPPEVQRSLALDRKRRTIYLVVRFGASGEQVAVFRRLTRTNLVVRKWNASRRRWTGDSYIEPAAVLRLASGDDLKHRRVEACRL